MIDAKQFSESAYLAANPDVADAVLDGSVASGWAHYQSHGRFEGRPLGRIEPSPEMIAAARPLLAGKVPDEEADQLIMDIYRAMEDARQVW